MPGFHLQDNTECSFPYILQHTKDGWMNLIAVEIRSSRINFPTSTPKIPQTPNGPGVGDTRECMFSEYDFQFHTKIIDYLENIQFSNVFAMFMYRMKRLAEMRLH